MEKSIDLRMLKVDGIKAFSERLGITEDTTRELIKKAKESTCSCERAREEGRGMMCFVCEKNWLSNIKD